MGLPGAKKAHQDHLGLGSLLGACTATDLARDDTGPNGPFGGVVPAGHLGILYSQQRQTTDMISPTLNCYVGQAATVMPESSAAPITCRTCSTRTQWIPLIGLYFALAGMMARAKPLRAASFSLRSMCDA